MEQMISFFGLFVMLVLAWLMSNNKRLIPWRVIGVGLAMQFTIALVILKTATGVAIFDGASELATTMIALSDKGAVFLFGDGFTEHFVAFKVLPTIIFVSSVSFVLFYLGWIQKLVEALAWVMAKTMRVSGAESLCAAANIFLGQTEAPLMIQPYLRTMTRSELLCMMTGGMATVAGGILAAYVSFGISAGHLLAASFMSAPATIVIAKLMFPETEASPTFGLVKVSIKLEQVNIFDAACHGAAEGLKLALNVGAMLIAFISLIALVNLIFGWFGDMFGVQLSFEMLMGYAFMPLAWVMGVPAEDVYRVGQLLGERMVINEFVSYLHLADMVKAGEIGARAQTIATYALCGFANFASIAIQIGGIGSLEPARKRDFAELGLRSMLGGTLASFMTACIAGILI